MNFKKITLVIGNRNFYGQTRKPWVPMNPDKIKSTFEQSNYEVRKLKFHELVNPSEQLTDSVILYSFSQRANVRAYIKDLVRFLDNGTNLLIPNYDLLKCHENKGYQELYKKKLGFESLHAIYLSSRDEISEYDIEYPVVLKKVDGSNGKDVYLIHNEDELIAGIKKFEKVGLATQLDLIRRKYFRKKKSYREYPNYSNRVDYEQYKVYVKQEQNFILQQFVPDLTFDYRVLVLQDRYYIMKRHNRKNDFRASGAKIHDFNFDPDPKLFDFARSVYQKFDTPFLSLDICGKEGNYFLIEFQASHFGLGAYQKSKGYYSPEENNWLFHEAKPDLETDIAGAVIRYLQKKQKSL
ncbi:hypothetical protein GF337_16950 [candidate division KSB1 bacterium]|nr:hypothetical protein [candidate division KSB1 bacterium]